MLKAEPYGLDRGGATTQATEGRVYHANQEEWMDFKIGQKVRVKPGSATARLVGEGVLTITRMTNGGKTLFVTGGKSGARWVGADEVAPVDDESIGT